MSATEKTTDDKRQLLRHTVATLAYRGGKAVSSIPDSFASFRLNETTRTPIEILTHIGDLFDWVAGELPGREALVSCHQQLRYTYRELQAEVDRCARGFLALGVRTARDTAAQADCRLVGVQSNRAVGWYSKPV